MHTLGLRDYAKTVLIQYGFIALGFLGYCINLILTYIFMPFGKFSFSTFEEVIVFFQSQIVYYFMLYMGTGYFFVFLAPIFSLKLRRLYKIYFYILLFINASIYISFRFQMAGNIALFMYSPLCIAYLFAWRESHRFWQIMDNDNVKIF